MTTAPPRLDPSRLRAALRRPGDALPRASIATVPILWNNVDLPDLVPPVDAAIVLDDIARTGYEGTQFGNGFPLGDALRSMLAERDLRLAEVYASIPCSTDGPSDDAIDGLRERLAILHDAGGEVLVIALDGTRGRSKASGRTTEPDTERLTDDGWRRLGEVVDAITAETAAAGIPIAFHPHTGTFVENPSEMNRLLASIRDERLGICLDVGHWTVGGGDPVEALRRFGERVTHVHLKDVDAEVLAELRAGRLVDFGAAIRARVFTELGAGVIDLPSILGVLAARDYAGWLMVEQDSCWGPPAEAA
ncbi:MAG: sugar phosphate isomerase/epimerase family protein, partial [Chloroflexota bacterium]